MWIKSQYINIGMMNSWIFTLSLKLITRINNHLCNIYQSRQVQKDDKMHFHKYRNIFQCNIHYKILLYSFDSKVKFSFQNMLINLATVNAMLKWKAIGNCRRDAEAPNMQLFWHIAKQICAECFKIQLSEIYQIRNNIFIKYINGSIAWKKYSCKVHFRSSSKSLFFLEEPEVEYVMTKNKTGALRIKTLIYL